MVSSHFDRSVQTVLMHEGGYSPPRSSDPGGATNWGISLRYLRGLGDLDRDGRLDGDLDGDGDVDAVDVRGMQRGQAVAFYRNDWIRWGLDRISAPAIAEKVFDLMVNMGPLRVVLLLQRALRAVGSPVEEDGQLGPHTVGATNAAPPLTLLAALRSEAAGQYRLIARANPALAPNLPGWEKRAYA